MVYKQSHVLAAAIAAALFALASAAAEAQTAASQPAGSDESGRASLGEIVVTATRREESIKDIPISVTAISGVELESRSIQNLADFVEEVPGVMIVNRGAGANEITIRGLNANATFVSSYQATTVGYYLNDMPLSENPQGAGDVPFFDLQRVEVLRGPQGTLFGEGAPGGVIRYLVNQPNLNKFEGAVNAQGFHYTGGDSSYSGNMMLNAPIVDGKLAARLVASYRNDGGFVDVQVGPNLATTLKNDNSSTTTDVRLLLKWQATEHLDANVSVITQKQNAKESDQAVLATGIKQSGLENYDWVKYYLANITLNWHLPSATVTSSSNYINSSAFVFYASPAGPNAAATQAQPESIRNYIQEFRAVSEAKGPYRWVLGAFYKSRRRDTSLPLNIVDVTGATPPFELFTIDDVRSDKEYAGYGELEYDVSKRVTLVAGGRWTHQESDFTTAQVDLASFIFGFPTYTDVGSTNYSIFTPKVSALFHLTDDTTVYGTIAKGFRGPGVKNFYTGGASAYGAETVLSYELGAKASLFNKRAFVAAAVYYNDWTNMQVPINLGAPWQSEITNAGKARTEGVELEARFAATQQLDIGGSAAFAESKLLQYVALPGIAGNQIGRDPKWTGSLFLDAHFPVGNGFRFRGRADYLYIGARYDDLFNTEPELSTYRIVNARLGVEKDRWEVYMFGRNLANQFATYTGTAQYGYSILAPRAVGLGATTHF
jgi:iron complex outermembrane receptor protein